MTDDPDLVVDPGGVGVFRRSTLAAGDVHDDGQGDTPDTFDDRLADLARLIDTLVDEADDGRRVAHRAVIVRLLARLAADALTRIADQLERVDQ